MQIHSDYSRPDPDLVKRFQSIPSSIAGDAMGRQRCTSAELEPLSRPSSPIAGPVLTVSTPVGSNYSVHKAIDFIESGDILVVDAEGGTQRAIWGELMGRAAQARKLAGLVIDGAIRDVDAQSKVGYPTYCRGTSPRGPTKIEQGTVGGCVSCDGVSVSPGDIAVCDADGVAFVPQDEADSILSKCNTKIDEESEWLAAVDNPKKSTLDIIK